MGGFGVFLQVGRGGGDLSVWGIGCCGLFCGYIVVPRWIIRRG